MHLRSGKIPFNVNISVDATGNIFGISNIPTYSYYLISSGNLSCIYYYESGTSILIHNSINYYHSNNFILS